MQSTWCIGERQRAADGRGSTRFAPPHSSSGMSSTGMEGIPIGASAAGSSAAGSPSTASSEALLPHRTCSVQNVCVISFGSRGGAGGFTGGKASAGLLPGQLLVGHRAELPAAEVAVFLDHQVQQPVGEGIQLWDRHAARVSGLSGVTGLPDGRQHGAVGPCLEALSHQRLTGDGEISGVGVVQELLQLGLFHRAVEPSDEGVGQGFRARLILLRVHGAGIRAPGAGSAGP